MRRLFYGLFAVVIAAAFLFVGPVIVKPAFGTEDVSTKEQKPATKKGKGKTRTTPDKFSDTSSTTSQSGTQTTPAKTTTQDSASDSGSSQMTTGKNKQTGPYKHQ